MIFTNIKEGLRDTKIMKFLKNQNVSQIIPFLLYLVFYMIWFSILERLPRTRFFDLSSELDTYIPFIVEFIIPYLSWFLFQAVWVVFVFFVDRKTYEQLTTMLMIGMTVFLVVSTFLPTKISLRPYYIESRGDLCISCQETVGGRHAYQCLAEHSRVQHDSPYDDTVHFSASASSEKCGADPGRVLVRHDRSFDHVPETAFGR